MSESTTLPPGWIQVPLVNCGTWHGGGTPSKFNDSYWANGSVPWISPKDMKSFRIVDSEDHLAQVAIDETNVKPFPVGTILVVIRSGILSRTFPVAVSQVVGTMNQDLKGIRPTPGIESDFVAYYLRAFEQDILRKCSKHGTTVASIDTASLQSYPLRIAPLGEQKRIVAKIEELFSDLDAGEAALKRAKANLKRYRAAVLKAAVEGKLTEEWRAKHPTKEPASALLNRILKERRQKWEADQLAKFAAAGKEPPKNWKEKYVEPTPPDRSCLPTTPATWTWSTLEALADVVGGVTKDQKKANQSGMREVPYLRVANVQRGFLDLFEMKSISATEDDIADLRLEPGDVLFTEGGDRDKLGRGWVWSGEINECIHQNHIFRGRFVTSGIQPRFVSHHGNTFGKEWFIKAGKQTTNLASINLGILRRFPVPIPPADEQVEIIAQVDEKLSQIDAAESQIEQGLLRAARLRQSILKQAFEGKLVPQDPTDEPANVLLERIRQRQNLPTPAQPRAGRGRRATTRPELDAVGRQTAYIITRMKRKFGRTIVAKLHYLVQTHLLLPLDLTFKRDKFGPFDEAIHKAERVARKQGWFDFKDQAKSGERTIYTSTDGTPQAAAQAQAFLGDRQPAFDDLLRHFDTLDTRQAELFATVYAAWNDLILDQRSADPTTITAEVYGWHESKREKFTDADITGQIDWLRANGYAPTGQGQRTQPIEPKPTSKRRRKST